MNYSNITGIGEIITAPSMRSTQSGDEVCTIDIYTSNNAKMQCSAWGKSAESISKLNIGDHILYQGQLTIHTEENKAGGMNIKSFRVQLKEVQKLNNIPQTIASSNIEKASTKKKAGGSLTSYANDLNNVDEEDLPF